MTRLNLELKLLNTLFCTLNKNETDSGTGALYQARVAALARLSGDSFAFEACLQRILGV